MSSSPRARLPAGGRAVGAMGVVSAASCSSPRRASLRTPDSTKPVSLAARFLVFAVAIAAGVAVMRARHPRDDLWRESRRASPPPGYCARGAGAAVCAHVGGPGASRAALQAAAAAFDCLEVDASATRDGHLVALHGRRGPREELELPLEGAPVAAAGAAAPSAAPRLPPVARRPPLDAVVGDYTLAQVTAMRWLHVRSQETLPGLRSAPRPQPRRRTEQAAEGPLPLSDALAVVLAAWDKRDLAAGAGAGAAAAAAAAAANRTLIVDVKRPEGAAKGSVSFDSVARSAAAAAAEAGCGRRCVLWAADDDASRALARAVGEAGAGGTRVGYVVAYAERDGGAPLVPRLEGVAQVAALDVAVLQRDGSGGGTARRGGDGGAVVFERAGQTLVAFVVDGGHGLRAAAEGGAHAVVTNMPHAVSAVLSAWRRRCERG
jgi:hypothetical protein